jgi:Ser/Thr protein kinase RdoA (MazF antagonist)
VNTSERPAGTGLDPLPAALVADAIARYGLPSDAQVAFVRHGENTTYVVTAPDGGRFALRLNRPGYQTPQAIRSELAWMASLRESGVRTPRPVLGTDGDPLQTAVAVTGEMRTALMFEWIDGVPLSAVAEVEPWERLGELMARLHAHAHAWKRPDWFTRPAWDAEALVGDEPWWGRPDPHHVFPAEDRAVLEASRAEVRARLDAIGTDSDRFGLIHSDVGFENVLVGVDDMVVIIDFDDSGYSWYMHDLAVPLYPHEGSGGFDERRDALVQGYRSVRELGDESLSELPTFLMARRIQTLGWAFSRAETAHARRQRPRRLQTTPQAARDFLGWARDNPL